MILHTHVGKELIQLIRSGKIRWAGNVRLKIYGTLQCASGKRMKRDNRVFFTSREEAENEGYRPCGHCLRLAYLRWKKQRSPIS